MAAKTMPWFRLYAEITGDPKIRRIARITTWTKASVLGFWVTLLALASEGTPRGALTISEGINYETEDLADITGLEPEEITRIIQELITADMLTIGETGAWEITNWDSRQFASDNSTERVRKYRSKNPEKQDPETPIPQGAILEYMKVYEKETGEIAALWPETHKMVEEFQAAGITPALYGNAIKGLKAKGYSVTSMTSPKNWAMSEIKNNKEKQGPSLEKFRTLYREQRKENGE